MPMQTPVLKNSLEVSAAFATAIADVLRQLEGTTAIKWRLQKPLPSPILQESHGAMFEEVCFEVQPEYPEPPVTTVRQVAQLQRVLADYLRFLGRQL
jgi:hypothetical protein